MFLWRGDKGLIDWWVLVIKDKKDFQVYYYTDLVETVLKRPDVFETYKACEEWKWLEVNQLGGEVVDLKFA